MSGVLMDFNSGGRTGQPVLPFAKMYKDGYGCVLYNVCNTVRT